MKLSLSTTAVLSRISRIWDSPSRTTSNAGMELLNCIEMNDARDLSGKSLNTSFEVEKSEIIFDFVERARSIGAQHAVEEVLVFLDAHCECGYNWLPPLIAPIARNDRLSTVPLIDVIDGNRYTFTPQSGGDFNGRAQGGWEWNFLWKRFPLPK